MFYHIFIHINLNHKPKKFSDNWYLEGDNEDLEKIMENIIFPYKSNDEIMFAGLIISCNSYIEKVTIYCSEKCIKDLLKVANNNIEKLGLSNSCSKSSIYYLMDRLQEEQFDKFCLGIRDITPKLMNKSSNNIDSKQKPISIDDHQFDVSFSFPGEVRNYVESTVVALGSFIEPNSYFYDNNYRAQLARPSLDTLLQDIYRNRSKLIVVFLCEKYQEKEWCGIEFRAIRDIIKCKENDKVMFIKMDEGSVDGVFSTDGYIDGRVHSPIEVARIIYDRIIAPNRVAKGF